jgi:hypothetical protein
MIACNAENHDEIVRLLKGILVAAGWLLAKEDHEETVRFLSQSFN